ncbi:Phosphoglycerate mutase [Hyphomicrobium denitrificans ATCC 51888]|uniref:Phosphoglycerate mutase n=1 Tax=Hyphomicrobium denitrificans (strain ATCC 51888 / DSM 1869 / NCIMB 11706 / TK 0415) TaxID=582899 RepID=D8JS57_HYPDA|nr:histidine phosphatase family protein [Hyphomicrobium denitrificans]ADJ22316.1 Phosphoglycerate mutase [Hyphomicrobium denitrificans ATCC 51888]
MIQRLTLISHAPTAATRAAAFPLDEGIDEKARRDTSALSGDLPQFLTAWTSPARRAVETAAALNVDAKIEPLIRDMDLGRWAGRTFADVEASEPEAMVGWLTDTAASPHGGESVEALLARVANWLRAAPERQGRSVAVTHPAVIRAAVVVALEANPVSFWRIDIAPLGIVELGSNGKRWTLKSLNG